MDAVNWLPILVAAAVTLVTGFIWYHPKLFGNAWMKASGVTPEQAQSGNMGLTFGLAYALGLLLAFFLQHLNGTIVQEIPTFSCGAQTGAMTGLLVAVPVMGVNALFERKSLSYVLINGGYWIVTMAIMGGILNVWQ
ncbi:MAG: DUF1761 domain-containing protein [Saprospiraceae bacterium]|nr:DUF1761 domain-containing protein [Saprospiraceae bacterium]